jgi:outer membrane lipoprotein carrier protein
MVITLGLLALLALGGCGIAAQAGPDPIALAARLQARYETIRDFRADFTQTYRGLLLREGAVEQGKLLVKKPSRLRFTYDKPDRKVFVADGSQFYSYFPEEKYGTVAPLPTADQTPTALLFLAGRGNLVRDFTPAMAPDQVEGEYHLQLTPKSPQADFESLTLMVDSRTLTLLGFSTVDDQGTSTIRFSNLKENTGLTDREFVFSFPRGTEIRR